MRTMSQMNPATLYCLHALKHVTILSDGFDTIFPILGSMGKGLTHW